MTERPANWIERVRKSVSARRTFELVSQTAILVWLMSFSLETLPNLPEYQRDFLEAIEWFTAVLFTVEYVIRLPGDGAEAEVFFSDLSHEYVTINAEYTT